MLRDESLHDLMRKHRVRDSASQRRRLKGLLAALRKHFDMDVAFISGFDGGERRIEEVDIAPRAASMPVLRGQTSPLQESYCYRVASGQSPELIVNAQEEPSVADLTATFDLKIGTHVSVPLTRPDGSRCGTLCCFSRSVDHSFSERDLELMRILADFVVHNYHDAYHNKDTTERACEALKAIFLDERFDIALQPIRHLETMDVVGHEALSRFSCRPEWTPDKWFAQAAVCGCLEVAELAVVKKALHLLRDLPPDSYLSVNLSPATFQSADLGALIREAPVHRLVFELTEHDAVTDYDQVSTGLDMLRSHGAKVAIDDFGAGYANFRHVLGLSPDLIKLDISVVRDIDTDAPKQALAASLVSFCRQLNIRLIAEGIETEGEKAKLQQIGVRFGQGFLLGKPEVVTTHSRA